MASPRTRTPFLIVLLALSLSLAPPLTADQTAILDDYFTRLEAHGFSGAVLVARQGQVLLRKGYGLADRKTGLPVTADTAFAIASVDKQFVAAAILHLEMKGKLSTEDRLVSFLPKIAERFGFKIPPKLPEGMDSITIHQLLSHTAGLDNLYVDQYPSLQAFAEAVLSTPLIAPPGARHRYSNTGYSLLTGILETVTGGPSEGYLRENLYLPARMTSTGFRLPAWRRDRVARYQDWMTRALPVVLEMPLDWPPAFEPTLSTVDDLYRWHQALQDDRILSAAAREKLFRPVRENYAYGWRVAKTSRGTGVVFHGGSDTKVGISTGLYRYPDEDAVVIVLANTNMNRQLSMEYLMPSVEDILFGGPVILPPPATTVPETALAAREGRYALPGGGRLDVTLQGGRLVVASDDLEAIALLYFPDAFAPDSPWGEDEQITRIFRGMDAGDFEPLRAALTPKASFDAEKRWFETWWSEQEKKLGNFLSVRSVYQMWMEYQGSPEVHNYLLLRFERGERLLRSLRDINGRLYFDAQRTPEHIELTLAPQSPDRFTGWHVRFLSGPRINFIHDAEGRVTALEILGRSGVTRAHRVATEE
jgi:CubicO group peptidase (beta-lactamase class C family)